MGQAIAIAITRTIQIAIAITMTIAMTLAITIPITELHQIFRPLVRDRSLL